MHGYDILVKLKWSLFKMCLRVRCLMQAKGDIYKANVRGLSRVPKF